ncbi:MULTISPECIES: hypothetical protein [unclassified Lentimonas]|uniref:hypothetical protein n=1 Tax=unclassified Lentimonas TaxID=2630993 RepID=UPI00132BF2F9|nr:MULTISPECIES: hypothetical protein [unclassified Lentimonas]CAA7168893.1 Unannotated [Lentimonas sp. CC21]CAA6680151.1 Unannotated [Lentimonas sp. CC4]CAA6685581.1 Unannotated [Lentimonas sp. CC6]CAA6689674.1 Unannotated [Lentimonas sp. CC19]CAA6692701.1 Unannotated [Lentimonas sp. CC10]
MKKDNLRDVSYAFVYSTLFITIFALKNQVFLASLICDNFILIAASYISIIVSYQLFFNKEKFIKQLKHRLSESQERKFKLVEFILIIPFTLFFFSGALMIFSSTYGLIHLSKNSPELTISKMLNSMHEFIGDKHEFILLILFSHIPLILGIVLSGKLLQQFERK